jgi:hypothetical protein
MGLSDTDGRRDPSARFACTATVLIDKLKIWIFEELVGEAEQFAHESGEGDFGGFAFVTEALAEGFENRVATAGA